MEGYDICLANPECFEVSFISVAWCGTNGTQKSNTQGKNMKNNKHHR